MKTFLLIMLLAVPGWAFRSQFTFGQTVSPADHFVPENLMHLARQAEEAKDGRFLRELGCKSSRHGQIGTVTCTDGGKEIVYEFKRQEDFEPESLLIMVPMDRIQ